MNYAELVQNIVDVTNRPELVPQIGLAIQKATLKFHLSDFFWRDVFELKVVPATVVGQRNEITLSDQLPRFRKISYLKGYDDVTDAANPVEGPDYEENSPFRTTDDYGNKKTNVYYCAGDVLTIWARGLPPKILVGYWAFPVTEINSYKSWIAEMCGFVIIDEACVEIFGSIGDNDEAARRRKMFQENLQLVRMQDIEGAGR